jgi:UDP-2,3-diacylglucosamine pyrophosphatase LpxH
MIIEKQPGGCIRLLHEVEEISKPYLLISDLHFDSTKCDRDLLKKHLTQAVEKNAGILIFGDFFDSMQGRADRRGNKSDLREEYKRADYFDAIIDDAVNWLQPFKDNILLISSGNHESKILQYLETDLLKRLTKEINAECGAYQGFIKFQHSITSTSRRTTTMWWTHGNIGGNVTKSALSVVRYASIAPDANIIVSGHTHDKFFIEHNQYRLNQRGESKVVKQTHLKLGNYKEEFEDGNGFGPERIVFPKSKGGWWLHFEQQGHDVSYYVISTQ